MYSPVSLEAQKLISMSIGKIKSSQVTRAGNTLHKSLLVASVLQRARNVYLDEERERAYRYPQCSDSPPQVSVTPIPSPNTCSTNIESNDKVACDDQSERVGLISTEANNVTKTTTTTTTVTSFSNVTTCTSTSRKRRRVTEQETIAAVTSILPKRVRIDEDISLDNDGSSRIDPETLSIFNYRTEGYISSEYLDETGRIGSTFVLPPIPDESPSIPTSTDSGNKMIESSDESDSDADEDTRDLMQVDQLASLVSYFTFEITKSDVGYESPLHNTQPSTQIVALTA